jgi:hypothetical protein
MALYRSKTPGAASCRGRSQPGEGRSHVAGQPVVRKTSGGGLRHEEQAAARRPGRGQSVEGSADPAPDQIANHRLADRLRNGNPNPRPYVAGRAQVGGEGWQRDAATSPAHVSELGLATQRIVPAHRRLDRQALTALLTAACEHVAAVLGGHPLEKTVDALTASIVGLVGAFQGKGSVGTRPPSIAGPRSASQPHIRFYEELLSHPHRFISM